MSLDELAVKNFQKYIQIPTLSQTTDYVDCVEFLRGQAQSLNLSFEVIQLKPKRPVVMMKWIGLQPDLPCIFLNSHMDVVPVEEEQWTYPPFDAHIDEEGRIFGRGTQDMKIVGIQYLEAIRRLQLDGIRLARTLVVTFVPDEEIGGQEGMKLFVQTPEFKSLNIAFGLDEGCGSSNPKLLYLFYGEKHKWSLRFHVTGSVGHGSLNMENTAGEKLARLLRSLYDFRTEEMEKSQAPYHTDVTSLNVTKIEGGQQDNVIPSEFQVTTDIRLPPNVNLEAWNEIVQNWCSKAGDGVWAEQLVCEIIDKPTDINKTPFYQVLVDTLKQMDITAVPIISMAVSDSRFIRNLNIPILGFSPLTCEMLIHQHNEYVDKAEFLAGITFYIAIFKAIGNKV
ncbi:aminoacylase-1-like isoform X2 [Atheta coriaria]|uniref:aminoacylase-1-like isoform X2 n=1 Tax=Dalotia coriaria TaxID=877792 RepID=UPI0031F369CA